MDELKPLKFMLAKGTPGEWRFILDEPYEGRITGPLGGLLFRVSLDDACPEQAAMDSANARTLVLLHNLSAPLLRVVEAAEVHLHDMGNTEKIGAVVDALVALREAAKGGGA